MNVYATVVKTTNCISSRFQFSTLTIADLPGPSKKRPPLKKQITDDDIQSRLDALKRKI